MGDADEILPFDLKAAFPKGVLPFFIFPHPFTSGALCLFPKWSGSPMNVACCGRGCSRPAAAGGKSLAVHREGADLVIFSGGKTLMGPQSSGLIVGRKDLIEDCLRFGSPAHGICRDSKVSREGMIGLAAAIDRYLALDQKEERKRMSDRVDRLILAMSESGLYQPYRKRAWLCGTGLSQGLCPYFASFYAWRYRFQDERAGDFYRGGPDGPGNLYKSAELDR